MNESLQQRTSLLDSDRSSASRPSSDYETDFETIQEEKGSFDNQNLFEQKQLVKKFNRGMEEFMCLLTLLV